MYKKEVLPWTCTISIVDLTFRISNSRDKEIDKKLSSQKNIVKYRIQSYHESLEDELSVKF